MALEYGIVNYVEQRGDLSILHFTDGKQVVAYPDGRGHWLPGANDNGAPPPYEPWEPPAEPTDPPPPGSWSHPLPGGVLTSGFGWRSGGFHYGIDLSTTTAAVGGPVKAVTDIEITVAVDAFEGGNSTAGTYVKGNNGVYTFTYAHGADNTLAVAAGQTVPAGTTLFMEGATGNVTGTHLHFEIVQGVYANPWAPPYNNGAQFIDPLPVLRANGVNI